MWTELETAEGGPTRVVLVEGDAGIGKTALLREFSQCVGASRVRSVVAEPVEHAVPYSVLGQLWPPLHLQGDELVPTPVEVGARLLAEFGDGAAGDGPTVVILDDAHWADEMSLQALLFAIRRMSRDTLLVVLACRPESRTEPLEAFGRLVELGRGRRVRLRPFDDRAIAELGHELCGVPLSRAAAARLQRHTGGTPLYAATLLRELTASVVDDLTRALPAPRSFVATVLERLAACRPDTRALVGAVAVLGTTVAAAMAAAVAGVLDVAGAVTEAVRVGLLEERGSWLLAFSHPLVNQAVYDVLTPSERAHWHERAAGLAPDEASRLRHLVAASPGPNPQLAQELIDYARRAAARNAHMVAAQAFTDAFRQTVDRPDGPLLDAVEQYLLAGDFPTAQAWLGEVSGGGARAAYLRGWLTTVSGDVRAGEALLVDAHNLATDDVQTAAFAARQLSRLALVWGRGEATVRWAQRARELGADATGGNLVMALALNARLAEARHLARVPTPTGGEATMADLEDMYAWGVVCCVGELLPEAAQAFTEVVSWTTASPFADISVAALGLLAEMEYRIGDWDAAVTHGQLAAARCVEAGHEWMRPSISSLGVAVLCRRGESDDVQAVLAQAKPSAVALGGLHVAYVATADARFAHTLGDYQHVLEATALVAAMRDLPLASETGMFDWRGLRAEALARLGALPAAAEEVRQLRGFAAVNGHQATHVLADRAEALICAARGETDRAEACFASALDRGSGLPMPYELALSRLYYGEFLRRAGRRRPAVEQLGASLDTFRALRARPHALRTEQELAASGQRVNGHGDAPVARLTPQELAVARLVSRGMSNKEAAMAMVLSVKTIEYHLANVYSKLNVRSRTQLAHHVAAGL